MKTTQYLYQLDPSELPSMREGLLARLNAAKSLLSSLIEVDLKHRDFKRIKDVMSAIEYCENLLEESNEVH